MSFVDIMWAIVSGFMGVCLAACVVFFAVALTYLEVTEGGEQRENAKR